MNFYFLGLVQDSKKEKRESIFNGLLPNGREESIVEDDLDENDIEFIFYNNDILKFRHSSSSIELKVGKEVSFQLEKYNKFIKGSFWLENYVYPLEVKYPFIKSKGFSYTLEKMKIDSMPLIKKKNWTKRMLINLMDSFSRK
jgi:hypothetical protein